MITKHNISSLFEFVKNQKKSNNLRVDLINKSFVLSQHSKIADISIDKYKVVFNCKIEKKIKEIGQILLPILMLKKKFYIGQIGQSLDGKIALLNGNSHYINDKNSISYLHSLRSICDAVVVGVNTIRKDDPLLTTRAIKGPNPQRIIIDPSLKLTNKYKVFKDGMPNIIFTHSKLNKKFNNTQIYKLPERNFTNLIYQNINRLGYKLVLVEGGSKTISKFLENRLLNIMQFIIAPTIIGSGINSINIEPITNLKNVIRTKNNIFKFGKEIIVSLEF
jgi:diaminohydroxyphosphoribosylaminopyrimidine deaminase/5-amino-6-(5-phosphoribosylamino)uracil reductase